MIQANELRIGNYIYTKHFVRSNLPDELRPHKVVSICEDGIDVKYAGWGGEEPWDICAGTEEKEIEPIPLTPELLEKCGFENIEHFKGIPTGVFVKDGLKIGYHLDDFINDRYTAIFDDLSTKVQYLHQLQNLYYALTGTELTVNL